MPDASDRVAAVPRRVDELEQVEIAEWVSGWLANRLRRRPVAGYARLEDAIVFGATRAQVSDVWSGGRPAVSAHRLIAFDAAELAAVPATWATRLKLGAAA